MTYRIATPQEIKSLTGKNITVIDIRSREDWAREHIDNALSFPMNEEGIALPLAYGQGKPDIIVFHCQSGMRTKQHADSLASLASPTTVLIMEGGINAWKKAGYPTRLNRSQPIPLMRQVQIVAGTLTLAGTLAGSLLSPWFYVIPGLVGTGLTFAGISGWCGMAKLLSAMPWNNRG